MKILSFDTSSSILSVAITDDETLLGAININSKNYLKNLIPTIDYLLKEIGISIRDIDVIVSGIGPGSFSGIRIGIATAKTLSICGNLKLKPISSLDILALPYIEEKRIICTLLDAKQNKVFSAIYQIEKNRLNRLTDYLDIKPLDLKKLILNYPQDKIILVGEGLKVCYEIFTSLDATLYPNKFPDAYYSAIYSKYLEEKSPDEVLPLYVRSAV